MFYNFNFCIIKDSVWIILLSLGHINGSWSCFCVRSLHCYASPGGAALSRARATTPSGPRVTSTPLLPKSHKPGREVPASPRQGRYSLPYHILYCLWPQGWSQNTEICFMGGGLAGVLVSITHFLFYKKTLGWWLWSQVIRVLTLSAGSFLLWWLKRHLVNTKLPRLNTGRCNSKLRVAEDGEGSKVKWHRFCVCPVLRWSLSTYSHLCVLFLPFFPPFVLSKSLFTPSVHFRYGLPLLSQSSAFLLVCPRLFSVQLSRTLKPMYADFHWLIN